jgi:hypothetical protein
MEKNVEQLLVIGNGFDLACNLPSKYEDFYKSRYTSDIVKFLNSFEKQEMPLKYEDIKLLSNSVSLNIWDYILYFIEDVEHNSWTDVETVISKHIKGMYIACFNPYFIYKDTIGHQIDYQKIFFNLLKKYTTDNENTEKVELFFNVKDGDTRWKIINSYILKELKIFEGNFAKYLKLQVKKSGYNENMDKLFSCIINEYERANSEVKKSDLSFNTSILTFNYTRILRESKNFKVKDFRNVHGNLNPKSNGIIFGIDYQELLSLAKNKDNSTSRIFKNPEVFLDFTKTFRTLQINNSFGTKRLCSQKTKIIKFYGHGLGEADYSYFMAMFDAVDLYAGDTILTFYYNPNLKDEAKKQYERVSKLILKYAATLQNENHGENLLHKLILENRIKIKPIIIKLEELS